MSSVVVHRYHYASLLASISIICRAREGGRGKRRGRERGGGRRGRTRGKRRERERGKRRGRERGKGEKEREKEGEREREGKGGGERGERRGRERESEREESKPTGVKDVNSLGVKTCTNKGLGRKAVFCSDRVWWVAEVLEQRVSAVLVNSYNLLLVSVAQLWGLKRGYFECAFSLGKTANGGHMGKEKAAKPNSHTCSSVRS